MSIINYVLSMVKGQPIYILIPCGVIGLLLCFFGHTLRRVWPTFLGFVFGIALGLVRVIWVTYTNGPVAQRVRQTAWRIEYFYNNQDIFFDNLRVGINFDWVLLPLILALLFALLGFKLRRGIAALSFSAPGWFYICYLSSKAMSSSSSQIVWFSLIMALVIFLIIYMTHNLLMVVSLALIGSTMLTVAAAGFINFERLIWILSLLCTMFIAGCVTQGILLHKHKEKLIA